jgi:hypothetical protein
MTMIRMNYVISLSQLVRWLGQQAEELGGSTGKVMIMMTMIRRRVVWTVMVTMHVLALNLASSLRFDPNAQRSKSPVTLCCRAIPRQAWRSSRVFRRRRCCMGRTGAWWGWPRGIRASPRTALRSRPSHAASSSGPGRWACRTPVSWGIGRRTPGLPMYYTGYYRIPKPEVDLHTRGGAAGPPGGRVGHRFGEDRGAAHRFGGCLRDLGLGRGGYGQPLADFSHQADGAWPLCARAVARVVTA